MPAEADLDLEVNHRAADISFVLAGSADRGLRMVGAGQA